MECLGLSRGRLVCVAVLRTLSLSRLEVVNNLEQRFHERGLREAVACWVWNCQCIRHLKCDKYGVLVNADWTEMRLPEIKTTIAAWRHRKGRSIHIYQVL